MDKEYWDSYYKKKVTPQQPSQFACDILEYLEKGKKLLEIGCGNGRDALFFGANEIEVVAVDQSEVAIEELKMGRHSSVRFMKDNFVDSKVFKENQFDYVYSRFTLHSISEKEQEILLDNVYKTLKNEGQIFIEVRSVKDELYGLGEKVERNAYIYDGHYRRFIVMEEILKSLEEKNFTVTMAQEANNCAIHGNENPIVIRIQAKKVI